MHLAPPHTHTIMICLAPWKISFMLALLSLADFLSYNLGRLNYSFYFLILVSLRYWPKAMQAFPDILCFLTFSWKPPSSSLMGSLLNSIIENASVLSRLQPKRLFLFFVQISLLIAVIVRFSTYLPCCFLSNSNKIDLLLPYEPIFNCFINENKNLKGEQFFQAILLNTECFSRPTSHCLKE